MLFDRFLVVPIQTCGVCHIFDDLCTNICFRHSPCITSKPECRNLCLRHGVQEVANMLNWIYRTNQGPSFYMPTFINQVYGNVILWQHGRLDAGRRIPAPACVFHTCVRGSESLMSKTLGIIRHIQTPIYFMIL